MNTSFDPLRLVNTYGAFGTVSEDRIELIIESAENVVGPWHEYDFKVKPGKVDRIPKWITPYHYRLDWQMWIAACLGSIDRNPWMLNLLLKLLMEDKDVLKLFKNDPWCPKTSNTNKSRNNQSEGRYVTTERKAKPKYIRVEKYLYRFNHASATNGTIWKRQRVGRFFPKQGICSVPILEEKLSSKYS